MKVGFLGVGGEAWWGRVCWVRGTHPLLTFKGHWKSSRDSGAQRPLVLSHNNVFFCGFWNF